MQVVTGSVRALEFHILQQSHDCAHFDGQDEIMLEPKLVKFHLKLYIYGFISYICDQACINQPSECKK